MTTAEPELGDFHPGTSHRRSCPASISSDNPCTLGCIHDLYAVAEGAVRLPEYDSTPFAATAASRPCELYGYHAPKVVRTQGHHRHPVYLQNRVYGQIRDTELMWLCGSCHDAVHEWIGFLLGETRRPDPEPGRLAKDEAQTTVTWFRGALTAQGLVDGPLTPPEG